MAKSCCAAISRKRLDLEHITADTALSRCLGLLDLTALGVGSTLGLGVYVLAGEVARNTAGPAVCISFMIAALASGLAGLCYAEFASRFPKAGSAYVWGYVTKKELFAFILGWNLVLEYVVGITCVARGFSVHFDNLIGNVMNKTLRRVMPINVSFLAEYPDIFGFGVVMLITILLAVGVKKSSLINTTFTAINLITLSIIIVTGSMKADPKNWFIGEKDIPKGTENPGKGGFMPFGMNGVWSGAATCFFTFIGFGAITSTGEEAKNPQLNVPWAMIISHMINLSAFFAISIVVTMMWPYYDQNTSSPFPHIFEQIGWPVVKWIVMVGVLFAICTSMIGAMISLPRILYAMASDGLLFKSLGKVHPRTQTPLVATIISGLLAAFWVLLFNVKSFIHTMSLGSMIMYAILPLDVLRLRYQPILHTINPKNAEESQPTVWRAGWKKIFNLNGARHPTRFSSRVADFSISVLGILAMIFVNILNKNTSRVMNGDLGIIVALSVVGLITVLVLVALSRQPVFDEKPAFKVPFAPLLPWISCFLNSHLMLQFELTAWILLLVWMVIGLIIYFTYGIRNSVHKLKDEVEEQIFVPVTTDDQNKQAGVIGIAGTGLQSDTLFSIDSTNL